MKIPKWIRVVFLASCLYDGIIGLSLLLAYDEMFTVLGISFPNPRAYVELMALLLIVVSIMFYDIARKPIENRNMIIYAILVKCAYCVAILPHWIFGNISFIFAPFAFFDLVFIAFFIKAHYLLKKM